MPSPVGHALAGVAAAWIGDLLRPGISKVRLRPDTTMTNAKYPDSNRLAAACALLAALPDVDILFGSHQTYTHSLGATVVVATLAAVVASRLKLAVRFTALVCGGAYASHLLLDWLSSDSSYPVGILALWPLSSAYFKSGASLFLDVSRRYWRPEEFIFGNARSVAREVLVIGPVLAVLRVVRVKTFARLPPKVAGSNETPK